MVFLHVAVAHAPDYPAREPACRPAHLERARDLRARGLLIGGGPAPDGRRTDLFYRLRHAADLEVVVADDPCYRGGAWTAYTPRGFSQFVEPWALAPVAPDGSRRASIVEGPATDPDMAQLALVELRGAGHLRFGGLFDDRDTLAVLAATDPDEAVGWLAETGFWPPDRLTGRPLVQLY